MLNGLDTKALLKSGNTSLISINEHLAIEDITTGTSHNNIGIRHGKVTDFFPWVSHSSRHSVDNSAFWVNSMLIPVGGTMDITFPVAATILGIASTSTDDDVAGTGALLLLIEGLDANWDIQAEVVTLTGQVKVLTVNTFIRVNELTILTTGSTGSNQGDIYVSDTNEVFSSGVPTLLVHSTMAANWNWGAGGVYSSPRNTKICTTHFKCSSSATDAKPLLLRAEARPFGLPVLRVGDLVFSAGASNFVNDGFGTLNGKSDWILRSKSGSASSIDISVMWWGFILSADPSQGQ